ncbi:hypothetical protein PAXINDRAFT_18833 [Paxillus involutus ATCC 200175]|uniref:Uncharacterized protein n=1 Tax=Paxillus involutus ATCC 200175 TaxID=664439 RepID=A0A0C9SXZ5_PAXIN|nr:hypothetical protein PAXINDRAFT_18833 [Paxillus involutus ATCC 200175]
MPTPAFHTPHAAATSQNVTLPPIPELFDPDLLFPAPQSTIILKVEVAEDFDAVVDALRSTAHQKLTTNAAPTFDSTLPRCVFGFRHISSTCWKMHGLRTRHSPFTLVATQGASMTANETRNFSTKLFDDFSITIPARPS